MRKPYTCPPTRRIRPVDKAAPHAPVDDDLSLAQPQRLAKNAPPPR